MSIDRAGLRERATALAREWQRRQESSFEALEAFLFEALSAEPPSTPPPSVQEQARELVKKCFYEWPGDASVDERTGEPHNIIAALVEAIAAALQAEREAAHRAGFREGRERGRERAAQVADAMCQSSSGCSGECLVAAAIRLLEPGQEGT